MSFRLPPALFVPTSIRQNAMQGRPDIGNLEVEIETLSLAFC